MGCRGAGAGLQLHLQDVELLLRELLLERSDFGLCLKFRDAVAQPGLTVERVNLGILRVAESPRGVGSGFAGFGAAASVEDGEDDLDAEDALVGLDGAVELLQRRKRVGEGGVAVVLSDEIELRSEAEGCFSLGLLVSGLRVGKG